MKRFILIALLLSTPVFAADAPPPAKCATVADCQDKVDSQAATIASQAHAIRVLQIKLNDDVIRIAQDEDAIEGAKAEQQALQEAQAAMQKQQPAQKPSTPSPAKP